MASGMISPVFNTEEERIKEQLAQAEALRQVGLKGNTGSGYHGGRVFIVGNPLGNIASGLAGAFMGDKARTAQAGLEQSRNAQREEFLQSMPSATEQQTYDPVANPGTGPLMNGTFEKPYEQQAQETQNWAARGMTIPGMEGIGAFGIQQKLMAPEKKAERALLTEARKYETERKIAEQQWQFDLMYPLHKMTAEAKVAKAAEPSPAQVKQQEAETAAEQGKRDLTTTVTGIAETLDKLDALGGVVNTEKSGLKNAMARTAGSTVGQMIGGTFGTQEQTYRDILKNSQMALLNDIKAANPKISSKQIDSNAELKTWLASLGDETQSIQARKQTLKNIVTKYGIPGGYDWENEGNASAPKTPTKPPEGVAPGATIKSTRKLKNGRTGVEWSDGSRTIQ